MNNSNLPLFGSPEPAETQDGNSVGFCERCSALNELLPICKNILNLLDNESVAKSNSRLNRELLAMSKAVASVDK